METKTIVKDPVCGMEIDPQDAVAVRELNGMEDKSRGIKFRIEGRFNRRNVGFRRYEACCKPKYL